MTKLKEKDFYESQEHFMKWISKNYDRRSRQYQMFGERILIEKWLLDSNACIVEIYANGKGFIIYQ
jgi:hypothetical protein